MACKASPMLAMHMLHPQNEVLHNNLANGLPYIRAIHTCMFKRNVAVQEA